MMLDDRHNLGPSWAKRDYLPFIDILIPELPAWGSFQRDTVLSPAPAGGAAPAHQADPEPLDCSAAEHVIRAKLPGAGNSVRPWWDLAGHDKSGQADSLFHESEIVTKSQSG